MRVAIAGGTGFIGQALAKRLQEEGNEVVIFSRKNWSELKKELPSCDAVINLAGTNVMAHRWTPEYKRQLFASRIDTTREIVKTIVDCDRPPGVFVNASATGYYSEDMATEQTGPGWGFLSQLCQQWEAAAKLPANHPTRGVIVRIGVALGREGGAFKQMRALFKWGLGGRLGSGKQGFPWIHIDDLVSLFVFLLKHPVAGIFNGVAPESVTNAQFTRAMPRRAICHMPAFLLKLLLGERSEVLLEGVRAIPERAIHEGFVFRFPTLKEALKDLW